LTQDGFAVDWLTDGESALSALSTHEFDVVVLDIELPKVSGLEVLRLTRDQGREIPILLLTARDSIADRVKGLDLGADDYLVKPCDLDELSARLRALHRRHLGNIRPILQHGVLELDPAAHTLSNNGSQVLLSAREFRLFQLLLENRGRVVTRANLEDKLFGWDNEIESNSLEVFIHHLRKKLGANLIRTVRGIGYTIEKELPLQPPQL
ncbi:MAG: response regulator, partial [Thiohalomonadales bacterium]